MKKLMMLILICASVAAYNQSYASGNVFFLGNKSFSKSVKTQATARGHGHVKKNKRLRGYNYYKYANNKGYYRAMGKAINGCR